MKVGGKYRRRRAFLRMFHQREGVLDALEEGILAIDTDSRIVYMNQAGLRMVNAKNLDDVLSKPLHDIYPDSHLSRLLTTGKSEYNVREMRPGEMLISGRPFCLKNYATRRFSSRRAL